jgi:PIN domain nuclease of toxin-antitoxin system
VNLLLDTHALLWWLADQEMSAGAKAEIADPANLVAVSAASIGEMSIKAALGKLDIDRPLAPTVRAAGFELLAITAEHADRAGTLPLHHRDPFDRMLIAQAQAEGLVVATRDPAFDAYEVRTLGC